MRKALRATPESLVRPWHVYFLRCRDGSLYAGATTDLTRRLRAHQTGRGAAYTRSRRPVELVYSEPSGTRSDALRREAALKRLPRKAKIALIATRKSGPSRPQPERPCTPTSPVARNRTTRASPARI